MPHVRAVPARRCEEHVSVCSCSNLTRCAYSQSAVADLRDAAPLAPSHVSAQFQHLLATKFTKAQMDDDDARKMVEDEDKVQAVKMGMFGAMTRETFEWHPHPLLCRRMNVPEPYPQLVDH